MFLPFVQESVISLGVLLPSSTYVSTLVVCFIDCSKIRPGS